MNASGSWKMQLNPLELLIKSSWLLILAIARGIENLFSSMQMDFIVCLFILQFIASLCQQVNMSNGSHGKKNI
jgi:hypothetical protein